MRLFIYLICLFFISSPVFALKAQNKSARKQVNRKIEEKKITITKAPKKEVSIIMNDPLMKKKWDIKNTNVQEAWLKFSKGSKKIVVAVIDTGIDVNHPDLKANIWTNPKEIPGNNIDDDGNCFVDDIHGWNFVPKSKAKISKNKKCKGKTGNHNLKDLHGHGSHIAGIIGGEGGNGIGISGIAPQVSLMVLKYYSPNDNGKNNLNNTVRAIEYAIENGAHIINYSGGGLEPNEKERLAIQKAQEKGILFVAAAGNEGSNTDKTGYYPANYLLNNILSITATDLYDKVLPSSNWGSKTVHKSAPGKEILSTLPNGRYGRMTGTSQATAVATGAAVLIMDYYKNYGKKDSARFVIKQLKMTGDIKKTLVGKTSERKHLNIFKALQARGKKLNFMDEAVDTKGKSFPSEKGISSFVKEPLKQDIKELKMVHKLLDKPSSKQERQPSSPDKKTQKRDPSSSKKKVPFLKRWFFNKKN